MDRTEPKKQGIESNERTYCTIKEAKRITTVLWEGSPETKEIFGKGWIRACGKGGL